MSSTMSGKGMQYSAVLHGVLLVLLIFGLPHFLHRHVDAEPQAITVDILPIAPMTNVKPQEQAAEPTPKRPVAQQHTERKATTETHAQEQKAEEIPEHVTSKQVVKKQEKKKPEKKEPKKSDDLASIFKSVKDSAKAEASEKPTQQAPTQPNQHKAVSQNYNPGMPLSMSEMDAIRGQVASKWEMPAGAKDAQNLAVNLHIVVMQDGTVTTVELAEGESRYASDPFFRAAVDAAIRAVHRASPLQNLPMDKYDTWRDMTFTFDPKDLY